MNCPLCLHSVTEPYHQDKRRYSQCVQCHLVFAEPDQWLDGEAEKAVYDLHENNPEDEGYRRFLSRVYQPLNERIPANSTGLDFGCGPGPTLSVMFEESGHQVALYDVYYYPDNTPLTQQYDFVTSTEVIEHLYQPAVVWQQWLSLLKPGGWLGLMTKMVKSREAFGTWHYRHDPTHVCFYSRETFTYLAKRDGLALEFIANDVILLRKPQ